MKHRPFSELTKNWSPERKARVAAMTAQLVDELEAEKRERLRSRSATADESDATTRQRTRHPAAADEGGPPRM